MNTPTKEKKKQKGTWSLVRALVTLISFTKKLLLPVGTSKKPKCRVARELTNRPS